jgi:hypothetical protein
MQYCFPILSLIIPHLFTSIPKPKIPKLKIWKSKRSVSPLEDLKILDDRDSEITVVEKTTRLQPESPRKFGFGYDGVKTLYAGKKNLDEEYEYVESMTRGGGKKKGKEDYKVCVHIALS